MPIKNEQEIYNALKRHDAQLGSYQDFFKKFYASGVQGYKNRQKVHQALVKVGEFRGSYEDFHRAIGWDAVNKQSQGNNKTGINNNLPNYGGDWMPGQGALAPKKAQKSQIFRSITDNNPLKSSSITDRLNKRNSTQSQQTNTQQGKQKRLVETVMPDTSTKKDCINNVYNLLRKHQGNPGTSDDFYNKMHSGYDYRKKVYDALVYTGEYNGSYNDFMVALRMKAAPKRTDYPQAIKDQFRDTFGFDYDDAQGNKTKHNITDQWREVDKQRTDEINKATQALVNGRADEASAHALNASQVKGYTEGKLYKDAESARQQKEFEQFAAKVGGKAGLNQLVQKEWDKAWKRYVKAGMEQNLSQVNSPGQGIANSIQDLINNNREFDFTGLASNVYAAGGDKIANALLVEMRKDNPNATLDDAKSQTRAIIDQYLYNYAVQHEAPKSTIEFLARKIVDGNTAVSIVKGIARSRSGSVGTTQAAAEGMAKYGEEHSVANFVGDVGAFGVDLATNLPAGYAGSLGGKLVAKVGARGLVKKGVEKGIANRLFMSTPMGRFATRVGGGVGNMAAFETIKGASQQFETGQYDPLEILTSAGRGALMGGLTAVGGHLIGNVGNKAIRATKSGFGKAAINFTTFNVSKVTEGTIFAAPDIIAKAAQDIKNSDLLSGSTWGIDDDSDKPKDNRTYGQIIGGSVAMMYGLGGYHALKDASRVIASAFRYKHPSNAYERRQNHMGISERIANYYKAHENEGLSKDEINELNKHGYGDFAKLFSKRSNAATSSKSKSEARKKWVDEQIKAQDDKIKGKKTVTRVGKFGGFKEEKINVDENGNEVVKKSRKELEKEYDQNHQEESTNTSVVEADSDNPFVGYDQFTKLYNDMNVSQATRAKMLYMLTGKMQAPKTIVGYDIIPNSDGTQTIKTYAEDGDIVTCKTLKGKEADRYVDDVKRQQELNILEVGEQRQTNVYSQAYNNYALEAIREMNQGGDPKVVFGQYLTASMGIDKSAYGKKLVKDVDKYIKEHYAEDLKKLTTDSYREEIKNKTGIDVYDAFKKDAKKRTDEDNDAIAKYYKKLFDSVLTDPKHPLYEYVNTVSRDNGRTARIYKARHEFLSDDERVDIYKRNKDSEDVINTIDRPNAYLPTKEDGTIDLDRMSAENLFDIADMYERDHNGLVSDGVAEALREYATTREEIRAMHEHLKEQRKLLEDSINYTCDVIRNKETGGFLKVQLFAAEGEQPIEGFVLSGKLSFNEDGTIDKANCDDTITIRYEGKDGKFKIEMFHPDKIEKKVWEGDFEQSKQAWLQSSLAEFDAEHSLYLTDKKPTNRETEQKAEQPQQKTPPKEEPYEVGSKVDINGNKYRIDKIGDGFVSLVAEDGRIYQWSEKNLKNAIKNKNAEVLEKEQQTQNSEQPNAEQQAVAPEDGEQGSTEQPQAPVEPIKAGEVITDGYGNVYTVKEADLDKVVITDADGKDIEYERTWFDDLMNQGEYSRFNENTQQGTSESQQVTNAQSESTEQPTQQDTTSNESIAEVGKRFVDPSDGSVITIKSKDNNGITFVDENGREYTQTLQDFAEALNKKELVREQDFTPTEGEQPIEQGAEQAQVTEQAQPTQEAQTGVATQGDASEPMPMIEVGVGKNKRQTINWTATTPERGHQYLFGGESQLPEDAATRFVDKQIENAQKNLDKLKKSGPKDALEIFEYQRNVAEHEKQLAEAQKLLDYWNAVKAEHERVKAEEAKAEEQETKQGSIQAGVVSEEIKQKWNDADKEEGAQDEITLPNGETISGHYVIVESGVPTASHQSTNGFAEAEGFPTDGNGQTVNDRDYKRDQEAQQVTRQMADSYDQRAVQSPVVVSQDGVVLSGNGRTMAGEIAAMQGTDTKYNDYLRTHAEKFGFTAEQVGKFEHPRLVFVADGETKYDANTFAKFNQREMKSQSKTEKAVKMGKLIDDHLFGRVMDTINNFESLSQFYSDDNATHAVIKQLAESGIIQQTDMADLFDGGKLSDAGQALVESILIGKVFDGNPDAVRQITEVKSMRKSVMNALTTIVANNRLGNGYSLAEDLAQAVDLVHKARQNGYKVGERVSHFARQGNLFEEEGATVADYKNAAVMMLADVLNDSRMTQLKKVIQAYNERAKEPSEGIADIFTGGLTSKQDIINEINEQLGYARKREDSSAETTSNEQSGRSSSSEQGTSVGTSNQGGEQGEVRHEEAQPFNSLAEQAKQAKGKKKNKTKQVGNKETLGSGSKYTAPNVDNDKNHEHIVPPNPEVQNHDWSQYKEGDIFDDHGYKYRFEYVSRDENGYVNGVVVTDIDENGNLGGKENLFPLMFMNDFKKVSDQGKADSGRTENGRVDEQTDNTQGEHVSVEDYVQNHPDFKEAYEKGSDVMRVWRKKLEAYAAEHFPNEESLETMMKDPAFAKLYKGAEKADKEERAKVGEVVERLQKEYQEQHAEDNTKHSLFNRTNESGEVEPLSDGDVSAITEVADYLGQNLHLVDSAVDKDGRRNNGLYDPKTGTIIVARDAQQPLSFVFGHEATHAVRNMSEDAYADLHSAVRDAMGEDKWNAEIAYKKQLHEKNGIKLTDEGAAEEVVSDYVGSIVNQGENLKKLAYRLKHPVLSKIRETLTKLLDFFRGKKMTAEEKQVQGMLDTITEAMRNAHHEANKTAKERVENMKDAVRVGNIDITDEKGHVIAVSDDTGNLKFSHQTYMPWTDNFGREHKGTRSQIIEYMKGGKYSEEEIKNFVDKMDYLYEYTKKVADFIGEDGKFKFEAFHEWNQKQPQYKLIGEKIENIVSTSITNGEYPVNQELSTDCIKREAFTKLMNTLIARGTNLADMGPAQINATKNILRKYGIQVACDMCFVEGKRLQIVNWAQTIVDDWNRALEEVGYDPQKVEAFDFGGYAHGENGELIDDAQFIPTDEYGTKMSSSQWRAVNEAYNILIGRDKGYYDAIRERNKTNWEKYRDEHHLVEEWQKKHPGEEYSDSKLSAANRKIKRNFMAFGVSNPRKILKNSTNYSDAYRAMEQEFLKENPDGLFEPNADQRRELNKLRNKGINTPYKRMVRLIAEHPEMAKRMELSDLLGSKGLMQIRQENGDAHAQLWSIIVSRFGSGTPKPIQDAVPYSGEIFGLSNSLLTKAYAEGGARMFSFSDFDITKVFDVMQIVWDIAARKEKLQSYSKESSYVLLFGKTGVKINISTLPKAVVSKKLEEDFKNAKSEAEQKRIRHIGQENAGLIVDENGKITDMSWSEEHSAKPDFCKKIFLDPERNANCGAVTVGASVNHSIWAAAQDWIRQVIPFHLSGMPLEARKRTDVNWYYDNTPFQNTRVNINGKWVSIHSTAAKKAKLKDYDFYASENNPDWDMRTECRKYLNWCEENGYRPRFEWGINSEKYREFCEQEGYEPNQQIIDLMDNDMTDGVWNGYYKFITDFTAYKPVLDENGQAMHDERGRLIEEPAPHRPVTNNFDWSDADKEAVFGDKTGNASEFADNSVLQNRINSIDNANAHMIQAAREVEQLLDAAKKNREGGMTDEEYNAIEYALEHNGGNSEFFTTNDADLVMGAMDKDANNRNGEQVKHSIFDPRFEKGGENELSPEERLGAEVMNDTLKKAIGDDSVLIDGEVGQRVLDDANKRGKSVRMMAFGEPYDYDKYPRGRVEPNLNNISVKIVDTAGNDKGFSNYAEAEKWAKENLCKVYTSEETGGKGEFSITPKVVNKYVSQAARDKSENEHLHYVVLQNLPSVLHDSIDTETHPNSTSHGAKREEGEFSYDKNTLVHVLYGAVKIGDKLCRVKLTAKEYPNSQPTRPYSFKVTSIDTKIESLEPIGVQARSEDGNSNNSISAAKLLKGVEMSYDLGKYLLEESEKRSEYVSEKGEHPRFFRTKDGEAYGFTIGGKIYIDPRVANSETPIHEYSHLWATAMQKGNPKEWNNIVDLMKGTSIWDEVRKTYPELTDDSAIADEVLAHYSGRRGAERLREKMRAIADGKGSPLDKADAMSALHKVKAALEKFWKGVADFLGIHYTSAEDVADRVMKDLLDGVDPRVTTENEGIRFQKKSASEDGLLFRTSEDLNKEYGSRWIDEQTNEDGRHTTQVKNTINSYKKFGDWVKRDSNGKKVSVLDASSGLGLGTDWMRQNGIDAEDVEPYPSENRNAPTYTSYDDVKKQYDYIISNAVLNVIPDDWRANVLHNMADKLKVGGKLVINVRGAESIIKQGKEGETRITLDDPSEILVLRPNGSIKAYQKGFTKQELKNWCEKELGNGYSVEIANNKNAGGSYDTAVVVTKNNGSNTIGAASEAGHPRRSAQSLPSSDAKLAHISQYSTNLDAISSYLLHKKMGSHQFLYYLASAFGLKSNNLNKSFYQDLTDSVGIRIADHSASASNIAHRNTNDDVYGLVIKLSHNSFKPQKDANYLEYVYYPDKLSQERQQEIVEGLKSFLQSGDYTALPQPDRVNKSGKFDQTNGSQSGIIPREGDGLDHNDSSDKLHAEKRNSATHLTSTLHLDGEVEILETNEGLEGRERTAKGWYDPNTGKIVVVLGNHENAADVQKTIFHEAVAHKGLRAMVGEEKFDGFIDNIYKNADKEIQSRIDELAEKKYKGDKRVATEEYMASLAEDMNFEKPENKGLLTKVKKLIVNLLKEAGVNLGFKLTDNDLRYILWRSHKNLMENGGKRNIFDIAEDARMRERLEQTDGAEKRAEKKREKQKIFRDGNDNLKNVVESMREAAQKMVADEKDSKKKTIDSLTSSLRELNKAMSAQRAYDLSTVKSVTGLVKTMMDNGLIKGVTDYEQKRMLSIIENVHGKKDTRTYVNKLMDIAVGNMERNASQDFVRLTSMRGQKVDQRGVVVQKGLDPNGQKLASYIREHYGKDEGQIEERMKEVQERMGSNNDAVAESAAIEYQALQMADYYRQFVKDSKENDKQLRKELAETKEKWDSGEIQMTRADFRQYEEEINFALLQNKIGRTQALQELNKRISGDYAESAQRAQEWQAQEKQRVADIQHNANSDLEGVPCTSNPKNNFIKWLSNSWIPRFLNATQVTFNNMLKDIGIKSADGHGYLYNRFTTQWNESRNNEITGYRDGLKELDAKAKEMFGRDYTNLMRKASKNVATVYFVDSGTGEKVANELTVGNLLYIYMVNKMADGRMKLRKMGISDTDVENIVDKLNDIDENYVKFADWMQNEFLPSHRNKYNEVHKRMFGTSMPEVEDYFPLKIQKNAINTDHSTDAKEQTDKPTTTTGAIKKRTRNSLPLDLLNADAFQVLLDNFNEMEHWSAFAEFNRDLNTLLNYKKFRNKLLNKTSMAFGSGERYLKNFDKCAQIVSGTFEDGREINEGEKAAVNIVKLATAAKISGRIFTAFKQLLSFPAYFSDANPIYIAQSIALPKKAWDFAMTLPQFRERWAGKMAGDPRLAATDADWSMWRSRIGEFCQKWGMSPNAFFDAVTVAIGSHAMYKTRYKKLIKQGYSPEVAEERARLDATKLFNETQQSSEAMYLSPIQASTTWYSKLVTAFRNSSISYTRKTIDSIRDLSQWNYAKQVEFMKKQFIRDGIDEVQAEKNAKNEFFSSKAKDLVRVAIFNSMLQFCWNMASPMIYQLFGDDEKAKKKAIEDSLIQSMWGSVEGFTLGDVFSTMGMGAWKYFFGDEKNLGNISKDMPAVSDITNIIDMVGTDNWMALQETVDLIVQSTTGISPESVVNIAAPFLNKFGADTQSWRECAMLYMKMFNCPKSQMDKVYLDEIGATIKEGKNMSIEEIAERYADYKRKNKTPLVDWLSPEESKEKFYNKYGNEAKNKARDIISGEFSTDDYKNLVDESKQTGDKLRKINELRYADQDEYNKQMNAIRSTPEFRRHGVVEKQKNLINKEIQKYLREPDPNKRAEIMKNINDMRDYMVSQSEKVTNMDTSSNGVVPTEIIEIPSE